ncbi:hypothetical protein PPL_04064 [Heterostelium album PN500]|uniref:Uncharacterized protein n=1 Tax=Heterostelium pallidum (strain ATCC 26659 / Pp 5 / PN500) TaxID=670386 RepID=D3B5X6_HETP5|nr:hypothetical protein PPL_04064 [Heterostelium album PN500]EFA83274.1 hypothetical protein PPL_04064 [Heterostelium album PN500]|eukprot:XP_020435391.1 hypothetical protein PPL_04064 [Heterostelium album PN500]
MGPVDTNNPVSTQVNINGKLPPQQQANGSSTSSSGSLKDNQIELMHPKGLSKLVMSPYQYWNDNSSLPVDKLNEPRQHILLPNFPSLLNQNINLNNSSYAAQHNWSASQFQAPQTQDIHLSMNKNQFWEGVNNNHSSVPSSPDHCSSNSNTNNIHHNNGPSSSSSSNVNNNNHNNHAYSHHQQQTTAAQQQQQQQQHQQQHHHQHHQQQQQQPALQSHYTTPNSSPVLSPNSYLQHQHQHQHQQQQQQQQQAPPSYCILSSHEDYERDIKRKTPLKSIPQQSSVYDFSHLTVAAYLHQQQMEMLSKKQKSSINHNETSSLPTTPHSFELERSSSLSSFNFAPRSSESVASSSSAPATPHHHSSNSNSAHHTPSSSIRSISPEMSSYIHQQQQQHNHQHQQSYNNNNNNHHNHPHHFSAPSSPSHHPISLPLLLTASASLPATPTASSTPSFDHTALSFSTNAALNSSMQSTPQSSAPVCSCLASKHVKPSSPSDAKTLPLSGQTPATLECEEFNVPLEYFDEWMETEGKISGVTYIKSGGKVIGAHADRKTLNLKAEYEKPRNGVRKTKRELLWTQKYVCSRAGLPKKKSEEDGASPTKETPNSRKKSVSKKCGCQSRIVISVYADDKSLAVVRKIADHSAHMTPQQLEELKQNYQRHFCLIHSNLPLSSSHNNSNNYPHSDDATLLLATSSTIANQQQQHHQQTQQQLQHQSFIHSSNNVSFDSQSNQQHMNQNNFTLPTPQIKKETELFSHSYQYSHPQSRFNTLVANLN